MKTKTSIAILSLATALTLAGSTFAANTQQEDLDRLAQAKNRLVVGAQAGKPSQALRMRDEAAELQRLIDAAQKGKQLDPGQVDRAIQRSSQGF